MARAMLTTTDNPFDPRTQYDDWLAYDEQEGHYTNSFLARLTFTSDELSEADQEFAVETTIDEIVQENISGLYKKLVIEDD